MSRSGTAFNASLAWVRVVVQRLDAARSAWAVSQRRPCGARSRPRALEQALGMNENWWTRIRNGTRRGDQNAPGRGLTVGQIQDMCEVMKISPADVCGPEGSRDALRRLAGSRSIRAQGDPIAAAWSYRKRGDLRSAAAILARELERPSPGPELWMRVSYLLSVNGDADAAIDAAREAIMAATLRGATPDRARGILALAHAHHNAGQYPECAEACAACLRHEPGRMERLTALQTLARALRALGELDEARESLRECAAVVETPGEAVFVAWLAADLAADAGDESALSQYQAAIEQADSNAEEMTAVDRAHLVASAAGAAYRFGREAMARSLMPAAIALLDELSVTGGEGEARAVLAAATSAAAAGERASAWSAAAAALSAIRAPSRR